jgi:hypothetical protein
VLVEQHPLDDLLDRHPVVTGHPPPPFSPCRDGEGSRVARNKADGPSTAAFPSCGASIADDRRGDSTSSKAFSLPRHP